MEQTTFNPDENVSPANGWSLGNTANTVTVTSESTLPAGHHRTFQSTTSASPASLYVHKVANHVTPYTVSCGSNDSDSAPVAVSNWSEETNGEASSSSSSAVSQDADQTSIVTPAPAASAATSAYALRFGARSSEALPVVSEPSSQTGSAHERTVEQVSDNGKLGFVKQRVRDRGEVTSSTGTLPSQSNGLQDPSTLLHISENSFHENKDSCLHLDHTIPDSHQTNDASTIMESMSRAAKNRVRATTSRTRKTNLLLSISSIVLCLNGLSWEQATHTYTTFLQTGISATMKAASNGSYLGIFTGKPSVPGQRDLQSLFFSASLPALELDKYVRRFVVYGKYSSFQFGVAFTLMSHIANNRPLLSPTLMNVHRLLTACMCIAITFFNKTDSNDNISMVLAHDSISSLWSKHKSSTADISGDKYQKSAEGSRKPQKKKSKSSKYLQVGSKTERKRNSNANPIDADGDYLTANNNENENGTLQRLAKVSGMHSISELRRITSAAVSYLNLEDPNKGVTKAEMASLQGSLKDILNQLWSISQSSLALSETTESTYKESIFETNVSTISHGVKSFNSMDKGPVASKNHNRPRYTTPRFVVTVKLSKEQEQDSRENNILLHRDENNGNVTPPPPQSSEYMAGNDVNCGIRQSSMFRKRKWNQDSPEDGNQEDYEQANLEKKNSSKRPSHDCT